MIEIALLLPIAAIGALVWWRKRARLDALLIAAAIARVERESGRAARLQPGSGGGWFVASLAADGVIDIARCRDARSAEAARRRFDSVGTPACAGELALSEWEPIDEAGAALAQAVRGLLARQ